MKQKQSLLLCLFLCASVAMISGCTGYDRWQGGANVGPLSDESSTTQSYHRDGEDESNGQGSGGQSDNDSNGGSSGEAGSGGSGSGGGSGSDGNES
jgi:hypothetical protein